MAPEGQIVSFLQQSPVSPTGTTRIDERIVAGILDQAKSIAASTAAMTVAATRKRHGMAKHSNTEEKEQDREQ